MQRAKAAGGARLGRMAAAALVPVANNYRGRQPAATLARQRPTYARVSDQCPWPAARFRAPAFPQSRLRSPTQDLPGQSPGVAPRRDAPTYKYEVRAQR